MNRRYKKKKKEKNQAALTSYFKPAKRNHVSTFKQYGDIDGKNGVRENWYK